MPEALAHLKISSASHLQGQKLQNWNFNLHHKKDHQIHDENNID